MKKFKMNIKQLAGILSGVVLMSVPMGFVSCTEDIDESNFAIKSEMTAADFIDSDEQFSMIKTIFSTVRLGSSENASPIYSVLTARGNYTVFLPTNDAVKKFMSEEGVGSVEELLQDSAMANLVAKSCIIDHQDANAYETADFPTEGGSFDKPNLNDRLLKCALNDSSLFVINGTSLVIDEDNEVSNGFIHVVNAVVAPSAMTLDNLIGSASNMKVFTYLLAKTTWADSLLENLDVTYEDPDRPEKYILNNVAPFFYAKHRYIGYTAFVEPDSIYESKFGIKVELDAEGNLTEACGEGFLKAIASNPEVINAYGSDAQEYSNPDNVVNRFVAYHLVNGKMAYNKLVHHFNEYNYKYGNDWRNPQVTNMPTNVWDYYTTMGKYPRLLKITQVGDAGFQGDRTHKIYVNRISEYANGPEDDYRETGLVREGLLVQSDNGENDNNGLNGFYYPVNDMLIYDKTYAELLEQRRIRIDVVTMLPELLSNSVRGGVYQRFENGYFDNVSRESPDTKLLYLMCPGNGGWNDYQGDEFMVSGLYDFTMQLPPVPHKGTYEIRMGVAHNSLRGMCQIYFGEDPDRLMPAGLPYDMRQSPGPENPAIPWIKDGEDWIVNGENDRNLRNQGYMKAPQYFTVCNGQADTPVRQRGGAYGCVRRIVTTAEMDPDKTYYLRFKTALKKTDSQFFMDYIEYASTAVYNGATAEDIW